MTKLEVVEYLRNDCDSIIGLLESKRDAYQAMCKKLLGVNKKKLVSIPVPPISGKSGLIYKIVYKANIERYEFRCSTSFFYKNNMCYADFSKNAVTVFSSHSLDRYSERVLHNKEIGNLEVFTDYLSNGIDSFHITLSTQKHESTVYYLRAEGLFLGDFLTKDYSYNWYNTCLSIDELFESQYRIYNSLGFIYSFKCKLKFDPIRRNKTDNDNSKKTEKFLVVTGGCLKLRNFQ